MSKCLILVCTDEWISTELVLTWSLLKVWGKWSKGRDYGVLLNGVGSREGAVVLPGFPYCLPPPLPQAVICLHALLNTCTANMAALRLYVPLLKNLCLCKNDFSRISCNLTFFSTVSPAKLTRSSGQNNDIMYMQVTCSTCEVGSTGHQ